MTFDIRFNSDAGEVLRLVDDSVVVQGHWRNATRSE